MEIDRVGNTLRIEADLDDVQELYWELDSLFSTAACATTYGHTFPKIELLSRIRLELLSVFLREG
jgi:hypothetical protein